VFKATDDGVRDLVHEGGNEHAGADAEARSFFIFHFAAFL
jgi:hypothetical protein